MTAAFLDIYQQTANDLLDIYQNLPVTIRLILALLIAFMYFTGGSHVRMFSTPPSSVRRRALDKCLTMAVFLITSATQLSLEASQIPEVDSFYGGVATFAIIAISAVVGTVATVRFYAETVVAIFGGWARNEPEDAIPETEECTCGSDHRTEKSRGAIAADRRAAIRRLHALGPDVDPRHRKAVLASIIHLSQILRTLNRPENTARKATVGQRSRGHIAAERRILIKKLSDPTWFEFPEEMRALECKLAQLDIELAEARKNKHCQQTARAAGIARPDILATRKFEMLQRHRDLDDQWGRWHTDLDLIVNYPAIHDVTHEDFAVRIIDAFDAATAARKKVDVPRPKPADLNAYEAAIDEFDTALSDGEHKAKLLHRSDALDPVLRRVMDTAAHLVDVLRRGDADADERDRAAKKLYRLLTPVVGETVKSAKELEPVRMGELEA